jgi:membrane-bound acyltransferase YfiQ involved in biofilm formation
MNKILNIIFFICLLAYVIMTSYYTLLANNFSKWGIFITFTLTILPTIGGIYFGYALRKRKNEN